MIVVDTSALYAILTKEPEAQDFMHATSRDDAPQISALTLYETMIVCYARGGNALLEDLQQLLTTGNIAVVPFDQQSANAAQTAYQQFGKGHHSASLNLGDCAAYGLAVTLGCPLPLPGGKSESADAQARGDDGSGRKFRLTGNQRLCSGTVRVLDPSSPANRSFGSPGPPHSRATRGDRRPYGEGPVGGRGAFSGLGAAGPAGLPV
ncbi:MAG: type II toxin-antitoxin system VapC family toxin [Acetobacteraceae bacterium]|nr:type II toxin-antitoxin system VapC family toxin [Acetobacteraceae bacterium]